MRYQILLAMFLVSTMSWAGEAARSGKTYWVRQIKEFFPGDEENARVNLVVFRLGKVGLVQDLTCFFPPGFDPNGLIRVRVGERNKAQGAIGYYCSVVQKAKVALGDLSGALGGNCAFSAGVSNGKKSKEKKEVIAPVTNTPSVDEFVSQLSEVDLEMLIANPRIQKRLEKIRMDTKTESSTSSAAPIVKEEAPSVPLLDKPSEKATPEALSEISPAKDAATATSTETQEDKNVLVKPVMKDGSKVLEPVKAVPGRVVHPQSE